MPMKASSSYYRARYYDPGTGRFVGEDSFRLLGDWNLYSYVANEPTDYKDPTGWQKQRGNGSIQSILDTATGYAGSEDWLVKKAKDEFPNPSNKCNKFVYDVLTEAGAAVPRIGGFR